MSKNRRPDAGATKNRRPSSSPESAATNLGAKLDAVKEHRDPQARGYAFERLLEDLFRCNGFSVTSNGAGSRPRQTDLIASHGELHCVIEAKWRNKRSDVSDVASVRDRVRRQPAGVTGCLFSTAGFTRSAVSAAEDERDLEVLLFGRDEIDALVRHPISLVRVIRSKQADLRHNGRAKLWTLDELEHEHRRSVVRSFIGPKLDAPTITCTTEHYSSVIFGECATSGESSSVEYDFRPRDINGLSLAFDVVQRCIGDRLDGAFAIHQTGRSWFGFGFEALIKEARQWDRRYRDASLSNPHHSESLVYSARWTKGVLAIEARHFINDSPRLVDAQLTLRFAGIPTDLGPLKTLADALGISPPSIRDVGNYEGPVKWLKSPIPLDIVAHFTTDEFRSEGEPPEVAGVVAVNPFFRRQGFAKRVLGDEPQFRCISEPEFLVCDLRKYHCVGDEVDRYLLIMLDASWVGRSHVIDAMADWSELTRCVRTPAGRMDRLRRRDIVAQRALADLGGGKARRRRAVAAM